MPTPHNAAERNQIASTVLMPGDPLRSEFVAKNFLENAQLVNNVRGVQGYTGTYRGTRLTVMASGMGVPSMGIYSQELYRDYDVQRILRIGSAGAMQEHVKLMDIVLGMAACTDSHYAAQYRLTGTFAPIASFDLLRIAADVADAREMPYHVGNLITTDVFYNDDPGYNPAWTRMGVLACEMESAALYCNAARYGREALTICTVSDHLITDEHLETDARRTSFTQMIELALETAVRATR